MRRIMTLFLVLLVMLPSTMAFACYPEPCEPEPEYIPKKKWKNFVLYGEGLDQGNLWMYRPTVLIIKLKQVALERSYQVVVTMGNQINSATYYSPYHTMLFVYYIPATVTDFEIVATTLDGTANQTLTGMIFP